MIVAGAMYSFGVASSVPAEAATEGSDAMSISCGKAPKATLRLGSPITSPGKNPNGICPDAIRKVVRDNFGKFRVCYEQALRPCPNLQGRVAVGFTIFPDGSVKNVRVVESDIPDASVGKCIASKFRELVFPSFEGAPVKVTYPIMFSPGG